MRRLILSSAAALVAIFVTHLVAPACQAGTLRYSWSGLLERRFEADDPWQLGPSGAPFELEVFVFPGAPDFFELKVEFASFDVAGARLLIDGEEAEYVGHGVLDFTDDSNGLRDVIFFDGDFQRFGETVEIVSAVSLDSTTYRFTNAIETPPRFSPATTAGRTGSGADRYTSTAPEGTPVLVVPEPQSWAFAAAALVGLVLFNLVGGSLNHRGRRDQRAGGE